MKNVVLRTIIVGCLAVVAGYQSSLEAQDLGGFLKNMAKEVLADENPHPTRTRPPGTKSHGSEPFTIKSIDGWTLVAHRFRPTITPRPGVAPIILCHGLTYNSMFWDLDPSCSLPRYLASHGYDVWVVDLRGCGMSEKWVWKLEDAPTVLFEEILRKGSHGKMPTNGYATINPKYANWSLDHHIAYDVPALVTLVRHHTKAQEVTWVGHSMGGIIALGHLAKYKNPGIGRLVTVGSQVTMPQGQIVLELCREMIQNREGQLIGKFQGTEVVNQTKTNVDRLFFNQSNALPKVYDALSSWAKDVPAIGLMQQYSILAETGKLTDGKQSFNYAQNIKNITIPVLFTCGANDSFAPPSVQKYLYEHVGSADKSILIFGRQSGFSVDAGHDDSLVGLNSRAEVYPIIEQWITGSRNLTGPAHVNRPITRSTLVR
jgi:pimeloyl-ACP methyl ester carboxylesterase